jgi:hypothetical protein
MAPVCEPKRTDRTRPPLDLDFLDGPRVAYPTASRWPRAKLKEYRFVRDASGNTTTRQAARLRLFWRHCTFRPADYRSMHLSSVYSRLR